MRYIKVRVRHHWEVRPSTNGKSSAASRDTAGRKRATTTDPVDDTDHDTSANTPVHPLWQAKQHARPSQVESIERFVNIFNQCASATSKNTPVPRSHFHCACGVLERIQLLVFESTVPDDTRTACPAFRSGFELGPIPGNASDPRVKDPKLAATFRNPLLLNVVPPSGLIAPRTLLTLLKATTPHSTPCASPATIALASRARRSLVAFLRAQDSRLVHRAADLLIEALDRNAVALDGEEVHELVRLVQGVRIAFPALSAFATGQNKTLSGRGLYDDLSEKVITIFYMAFIRLEIACQYQPTPMTFPLAFLDMAHGLVNDFGSVSGQDPHISLMLSSTVQIIFTITTPATKERQLPLAVARAFLCQILQGHSMSNDQITSLIAPCLGVLVDIRDGSNWHTGEQFLSLMATAASLDVNACTVYLALVDGVLDPWQLALPAIRNLTFLCLSKLSPVRERAFAKLGLFLKYDEATGQPVAGSWMVRLAATLALTEVYQDADTLLGTEVIGTLALSILVNARGKEVHELLKGKYLADPASQCRGIQPRSRRVLFLHKYVAWTAGTKYEEGRAKDLFVKGFVDRMERALVTREKRWKWNRGIKQQHQERETNGVHSAKAMKLSVNEVEILDEVDRDQDEDGVEKVLYTGLTNLLSAAKSCVDLPVDGTLSKSPQPKEEALIDAIQRGMLCNSSISGTGKCHSSGGKCHSVSTRGWRPVPTEQCKVPAHVFADRKQATTWAGAYYDRYQLDLCALAALIPHTLNKDALRWNLESPPPTG